MNKNRTLAVAALLVCAFSVRGSNIILPGWNLLETDSGTTSLFGHSFEGVPLGTFDFGSTVGVESVGAADTIIHRTDSATAPAGGSSTVPTLVEGFQLRSVDPVSLLGGPLGIYYVTLQSARGGPESTGTMTINFGPEGDPHGTFSSSFDLFVDVRLGALNGPILDSREIAIPDSGANPWRHEPTGAVQIPGVNLNLDSNDSGSDFWIEGSVFKVLPNGVIGAHNATTGVPDAGSTLPLLGLALSGLALRKLRPV
jgi:hypothetical protein